MTVNLKAYAITILFLSILNCSTELGLYNGIANNEVGNMNINNNKKQNESFDAFFNKFKTDSVYQIKHIVFPFKIDLAGDEGERGSTKYIQKSKWNFIGIFKSNNKNRILKKKVLSSNKVKIIIQIEDTGFEQDYFFERKNETWLLVLMQDISD